MYCTRAEIESRISESTLIYLTDDNGTGLVDEQKVAQAIKDAGVIIDPYAQKRYQTPFNPVPPAINRVAIDIAIYKIYSRKGIGENEQNILYGYKEAIRWLENLAKGNISLGEEEPQSPPPSGSMLEISSNRRLMSRKSLRGM